MGELEILVRSAIARGNILLCVSRSLYEKEKACLWGIDNYVNHYYYKFGDSPRVGICLRVNKG